MMDPQTPRNGTGRGPVVDAIPVDDCRPTGLACPIPRQQPQVVVSREMIFGVVGVAVGVGLTIWLMSILSKRGR